MVSIELKKGWFTLSEKPNVELMKKLNIKVATKKKSLYNNKTIYKIGYFSMPRSEQYEKLKYFRQLKGVKQIYTDRRSKQYYN